MPSIHLRAALARARSGERPGPPPGAEGGGDRAGGAGPARAAGGTAAAAAALSVPSPSVRTPSVRSLGAADGLDGPAVSAAVPSVPSPSGPPVRAVRAGRPVGSGGPDTPAAPVGRRGAAVSVVRTGPGGPARTGAPVPVPPAFDRMLRLSLAGGRLRPVPSAGGLHPVDVRLLVGAGCGVRPGSYAYEPAGHRMFPVGPAPEPAPRGAFALLGARPERTVAHYGHRAWPLVLLDLGHAAAALALAGASAVCLEPAPALRPWPAHPAGRGMRSRRPGAAFEPAPSAYEERGAPPLCFPFAAVRLTARAELGLWSAVQDAPAPPTGVARRELRRARAVLAELSAAGTGAAGPGRAGPGGGGAPGSVPVSVPVSVPAVVSGSVPVPDPVSGSVPVPASVPDPVSAPDAALLLRRRSAPPAVVGSFAAPPGREVLARILGAAETAAPEGPAWCLAVGGPEPGLWEGGGDGLRLLAAGEVLPTLAVWGAEQGWIAGAGAVLIAYGCPSGAGPRRIRRDHLLAGYGVGHAQIAAAAAGLASRPVGSWQRADLGAAIGGPPGRDWIVHGLAIGRLPADGRTADRLPADRRTTGRHTTERDETP